MRLCCMKIIDVKLLFLSFVSLFLRGKSFFK